MKIFAYAAAASAALAALTPSAAAAQDVGPRESAPFAGPRIEARLGYETPTISDTGGEESVYKLGSAVSYGGEIGFDLAAGNKVVVGPYGVYEFSSVELCDGSDCLKEQGNLGVGGRIGYVASPTFLVYAKVGYAEIKFKAETSLGNASDSKGGLQGAIGANVNFGRVAYGLLELNYADYGDFYGVKLQRRHVAAGIGARF